MRYVFLNSFGKVADVVFPTTATPPTMTLRRSVLTEVVGGTVTLTTVEWTKTFDRGRTGPNVAVYLEQEP